MKSTANWPIRANTFVRQEIKKSISNPPIEMIALAVVTRNIFRDFALLIALQIFTPFWGTFYN